MINLQWHNTLPGQAADKASTEAASEHDITAAADSFAALLLNADNAQVSADQESILAGILVEAKRITKENIDSPPAHPEQSTAESVRPLLPPDLEELVTGADTEPETLTPNTMTPGEVLAVNTTEPGEILAVSELVSEKTVVPEKIVATDRKTAGLEQAEPGESDLPHHFPAAGTAAVPPSAPLLAEQAILKTPPVANPAPGDARSPVTTISTQQAANTTHTAGSILANGTTETIMPATGTDVMHDSPDSSLRPMSQVNNETAGLRNSNSLTTSSLASPVNTASWRQELGQQMLYMARHGEQRVSLHLNPAELGPLQVELKVSEQQQAQLQLFSAHAQVRSAVEQAIPQLRDALAEQGIRLDQTFVGTQQQEQHSSFGNNGHSSTDTAAGRRQRQTPDNPASDTPEQQDTKSDTRLVPIREGVNLYV